MSRKDRNAGDILADMVTAPRVDVVAEAQFSILSSFSPSESFLSFVPPTSYPNPITCRSGVLAVKLYFTVDKEIDFSVHYVVS